MPTRFSVLMVVFKGRDRSMIYFINETLLVRFIVELALLFHVGAESDGDAWSTKVRQELIRRVKMQLVS